VFSMRALKTSKHFLSLTILFVCVPTNTAFSRSVFWGNDHYRNSTELCFVFDETPELKKSPTTDHGSKRFTQPFHVLADPLQIFENDARTCAFGFLNDLFTDLMVNVSLESLLLARNFLESAFRRPRTLALKRRTSFFVRPADGLYFLPRKSFARRIRSYVIDSQIYPKEIVRLYWRLFGSFHDCNEIEVSLDKQQVYLTFNPVNSCFLISTKNHGDVLSSIDCPKIYSIQTFESEDSLIVNHRRIRFEHAEFGSVSLISFDYFGDGSDYCLRGKIVLLLDSVVDKLLKIIFGSSPILSGDPRNIVTCLVKYPKSLFEADCLLACREKFDFYGCFHIDNLYQSGSLVNKNLQFLPRLKSRASL